MKHDTLAACVRLIFSVYARVCVLASELTPRHACMQVCHHQRQASGLLQAYSAS